MERRVSIWEVWYALAVTLDRREADAATLARAVCNLLAPGDRAAAYPYLFERLRNLMWPSKRSLSGIGILAEEAWHALPIEVRDAGGDPGVDCALWELDQYNP